MTVSARRRGRSGKEVSFLKAAVQIDGTPDTTSLSSDVSAVELSTDTHISMLLNLENLSRGAKLQKNKHLFFVMSLR